MECKCLLILKILPPQGYFDHIDYHHYDAIRNKDQG